MRYSEDKLFEELKKFKVMAVRHYKKKVDTVEQSTPALLTSETLILPEIVKLAWYNFKSHMCPSLCGASTTRIMGMEPTLSVLGKMDYQECVLNVA